MLAPCGRAPCARTPWSAAPSGPRGAASSLGTRAEELICASRGRQVKLTQSAVHEMFRGNRAALLEVFCGGMELTLGARAHGLCAPDGVDKLFPVGDQPWDLRCSEDQRRCRELEERVNPIVLSPPSYTPMEWGPHIIQNEPQSAPPRAP